MAILMRRTLMRTRAPILSSLRRMVPQVASAKLGAGEADAAQRAQQHIGHRGEPQAQLVGAHGGGRGAVGEQVELALLDAVLHLAAGAVDLLVEVRASQLGSAERGDDEARIGLALRPLGLADDAAPAAPALARRPQEVLEAARRLAGGRALGRRPRPARPRSRRPAARCGPGRTRKSTPLASHHAISSSRAKPESARSTIRTSRPARADLARRCASTSSTRAGRGVDVRAAAAWPPADAGRRTCRAADSSSSRSSRGRSGPPAGRAADRRWHRDRG